VTAIRWFAPGAAPPRKRFGFLARVVPNSWRGRKQRPLPMNRCGIVRPTASSNSMIVVREVGNVGVRVYLMVRRQLSLQERITGFGYTELWRSAIALILLRSWRSTRLRLCVPERTACARRCSISRFRDRRSRAASLTNRVLRLAGMRINSRSRDLVICLDIILTFAIDRQAYVDLIEIS